MAIDLVEVYHARYDQKRIVEPLLTVGDAKFLKETMNLEMSLHLNGTPFLYVD